MSDHDADDESNAHAEEHDTSHDHEDHHGDHDDDEGRVTSPMQAFESSEVTTGFVVLAVGLVVTFAVPLLL